MWRATVVVLASGLIAAAALAQPGPGDVRPDGPGPRRPHSPLEFAVERMFRSVPEMSEHWQEQSEYALGAMDQMFAAQNWTSEPDAFALALAQESATLPPWDVQGRFDLATSRLSERYLLDPAQEDQLRETLMRSANELMAHHMGDVLPVMTEIAQQRLQGEPFKPEQIAEWSKRLYPVFMDARKQLVSTASEFMGRLDPDQRAIAQADLDAAQKRMSRVEQLGDKWARGEWTPGDWGLAADPIQGGAMRRTAVAYGPDGQPQGPKSPNGPPPDAGGMPGAPSSGVAGGAGAKPNAGAGGAAGGPMPATPQAQPPGDAGAAQGAAGAKGAVIPGAAANQPSGPWADYVRQFITRYALDAAQQQRAWIIYNDATGRRDAQARRFDTRAARAGGDSESARRLAEGRATADNQIFEYMKRRLERLPTTAQRSGAAAAPQQSEWPRKSSGSEKKP